MGNQLALFVAFACGIGLGQAQPDGRRDRGMPPDGQRRYGQSMGGGSPGAEGSAQTPGVPLVCCSIAAAGPKAFLVSATSLTAPDSARKAYRRAAREVDKRNPNLARAAAELEKAVTLYPSFAAAWYFLGGVRLVLNEVDAARNALESAIAVDPRFPYTYLPLAAIELSARRYSDAARHADSVLKLNSESFEAHYYRALANGELGRHDEARRSIQAIVEGGHDQRYPGVHALLAVIFTREADFPSAAREYRRFLELDPESPAASSARQYLSRWRQR